jgi:glucose 1-dehydrogenase
MLGRWARLGGVGACSAVLAAGGTAHCLGPSQTRASSSTAKQSQLPLQGRVALVTGAGSGIGRYEQCCHSFSSLPPYMAIWRHAMCDLAGVAHWSRAVAVELARNGATVVINDLPPHQADPGRARVDRAEETAALVRAAASTALVCHADVSDRAAVAAMYEAVLRRFGRLDIVVSNAYYSKRQPILEQEWSEMLKTFEVTMFGSYHTCQLGAKAMVQSAPAKGPDTPRGKIIVISSVNAPYPYLLPNSTPYNMSKAALEAMVQNFASGLAVHGINVNAVRPGWILTGGETQFMAQQEIEDAAAGALPFGIGQPEDIAKACLYLASDDANYVSGTTLVSLQPSPA